MSLIKIINFPSIGDNRGSLIAMETMGKIPFNIKRAYFIFDTRKNVSRGFHAHKDLQQVAVCVAGKCRMTLDNGKKREDVWLDSPNKGIFIDKYIWREMHDFSGDCVLLVLASEHYSELDYIKSYDEFLRITN
jgi:dTDP-4-dehydrorhamnose 3,5-epimerase-like enzyme